MSATPDAVLALARVHYGDFGSVEILEETGSLEESEWEIRNLAAAGFHVLPEAHVWMDGKEWRVENANDLMPNYGGIYTLIPIDEGETRDG